MSLVDKAKDLLSRIDDTAGDAPEPKEPASRAQNGDPTATTGPGVAEGGPAEEQQLD
ncbi:MULTISPECIES: hypothetical protein [unclassified Pseudonocardia]|jgi:hypothetical protein|uniref:hypothetical protein n=1 Tax=unclassified Pseudonocardia TaxID=2619320 RepID=UPI001AC7C5AF|nr:MULTISPECIES: hypothetical protein [unclassified Pseudonocardia]MBN9103321.1 hypothetical protein [Pseudonocardia sp.]